MENINFNSKVSKHIDDSFLLDEMPLACTYTVLGKNQKVLSFQNYQFKKKIELYYFETFQFKKLYSHLKAKAKNALNFDRLRDLWSFQGVIE